MFLSIREALIHSIWTRDEKVLDNLSFSGNLCIFKKKTFCSTVNANIFQSIQSNLMKFLLHDLRQVKYKILLLDFKKRLFLLVSSMNAVEVAVLSGF